jgi:AraC family transcriptional regulator of adaptative response/methylated-DNA-[protein]-cysteine methyltransferase
MNTMDSSTEAGVPSGTGPVVGCRTTRIYCRPVCRPRRAPKPENCTPFFDAADAREAGYRPCKRCRPDELAPVGVVGAPSFIRYGLGATPIGFVFLAQTDRGLCVLYLLDEEDAGAGLARLRSDFRGAELAEDRESIAPILEKVLAVLEEGRDGRDIALDLRGTPFQLRVWEALRSIPSGSTRTYGDVAWQLGLPPRSARAVAAACAANPVALIVPCHRVVGVGGRLCGYGGGLWRKKALLDLERREAPFLAFQGWSEGGRRRDITDCR